MFLGGGEHFDMLNRIDIHRRDEICGQFVLVFDDVGGCTLYRFLVSLVNLETESLCSNRVDILSCAERVLADVRP